MQCCEISKGAVLKDTESSVKVVNVFFLLVYLYDYGQYLVTFCSTGSVLNHGHKTIVKKMKNESAGAT